MKIKTSFVHPPIPIRDFDWCAYDDDTYDGPGSLLGEGPTEAAAIADLLSQIEEEADDEACTEQLRLTEEDKRLAGHAAAIFADSEIRAKWGFPPQRLEP